MCQHDNLHVRVLPESPFQCLRIHIPGIVFRINKNLFSAFIGNRIDGRIKSHIGTEYLVSRLHACQLYRQMKRCGSGGKRHGSLTTHIIPHTFFQLLQIGAHR